MIDEAIACPAPRGRFQGVAQIVRYNWPLYIIGSAIIILAGITVAGIPLPAGLRWTVLAGLGLAFYWIAGSLLASYYVYDLSPLYRWEWIARHFPVPPARWATIHAGLDETTPALRDLFPAGGFDVIDIYDRAEMSEPSIERARRTARPVYAATPASYNALPLADGSCNAIFLIFAAHEIRHAESRERFFAELRRSLAADGCVLLVEHLRNAPNFMAYGPGAFHFLARSEWHRLARGAGFGIVEEFGITPLVRVFLLKRMP